MWKIIPHTLHLSPKAIISSPKKPTFQFLELLFRLQPCLLISQKLLFVLPRVSPCLLFSSPLLVSFSDTFHSLLRSMPFVVPFVFISGEPNQVNRYSQYPLFPMELLAVLIVTFARQINCISLSLRLHFF